MPSSALRLLSLTPALLLAATPASAGEVYHISIGDLAFSPALVTAHVGDTVEWLNSDFLDHTATAENGGFDVTMEPGHTARVALDHAGIVTYICRYHPGMTGEIRVVDP